MGVKNEFTSDNHEESRDEDETNSESEQNQDEEENEGGFKRKSCNNEKKNSKKARNELYKQPTTEELNQLKETENLYSSSLMRLQIEELLSNINVTKKYLQQVQDFWNNFQSILNNINNAIYKKKKIAKLDLYKIKSDKNFNSNDFTFLKPEKYRMFGIYKLKCISNIKNDFNVNINITIPSEVFQEKDYLNNRYLVKRNLYITHLYVIFKKLKDWIITIKYYKNLRYFPYISIQPCADSKLTANVFVTADETSFKLGRCLPYKNNIKFAFDENFSDIDVKDFETVATPLYNSMLARDWTLNINNEWLESKIKTKNVQDGIKLATIWLNLRELNDPCSGFTFEILLYTIAYLIEKKKINEHMSSYQIVRILWHFLANTDWTKEPLCISDEVKPNNLRVFTENFDIVFIDKSGVFNIASFLDVDNYQMIKNEARKALAILDSNNFHSFVYLFNTKIPFMLQFDAVLKIHHGHNIGNIYHQATSEEKWRYYGLPHLLATKKIKDLLRKGLSNRITYMVPRTQFSHNDFDEIIVIGLTLNTINAFNSIERGPSEEDQKAVKEFREFWGKFSDFRRFQDSTAGEVAIFPRKTIQERRNIFGVIIKYVLQEKSGLNIELVADQFEDVIVDKMRVAPFPTGTNEEASLKVKHICDDLTQKIRNLKLQLPINSIQGISSVFCYTDLFPPIPMNYRYGKKITSLSGEKIVFNDVNEFKSVPKYVSPIQCVIQLSRSSAWPNELEALKAIKCEFYLKIANMLKDEFGILTNVTFDYLDVFYEGLVFRFQLFVQKELILLKKSVTADGVTVYKQTEQSTKLEKKFEILPKIMSALNGVHQENPNFGSCCALIKRWLRSQMIDDYHIPDVVIDLWNASLYINQSPFDTPNLPQIGFMRFLKHIANFNSASDFVMVNFNNDIEKLRLDEIESTFTNNRNSLPPLYIVTPYDNGGSIFTKRHPSSNILKRMQLLADAAYSYLKDIATEWQRFDIKGLFLPNLDGYNIVIHLFPYVIPVRYQQVIFGEIDKKNALESYDKDVSTSVPIIDFNPVTKFLKELREIYGKYALFFHDPYGGDCIGILWIKTELEPKEFKISNVNCRKRIKDKLQLNIDGIVEDIYIRGSGIIKNIEKM